MFVLSRIALYFLLMFFVGAVLSCSFTNTSSHLGIFSTGIGSNKAVSVIIDPLRGSAAISETELMVVLTALVLAVAVAWSLIYEQRRLLLSNSILERWQLSIQAALIRLYDYLMMILRRGILQPNIY